ncbi:MAG: cupredoxin domain-containing protein [Burkholderiaceae bacterium]|nr:MAG: cupredoxin domain-containing protein [Burkholderiaceae bacterium]
MLRLSLLLLAFPVMALAADPVEVNLAIRDHRFDPAELHVPAGQKIRLIVENKDSTPEEFESHELNREKVIPGNTKSPLYIGPLQPGRYHFFGDFNPKTAQGDIVAE